MTQRRRARPLLVTCLLSSLVGIGLVAYAWLNQTPYRAVVELAPTATRPALSQSVTATPPDASAKLALEHLPDAAAPAAERPRLTVSGRAPMLEHTENTLLVGLDRFGQTRGGRTDTLLLAILDPTIGHLAALSIPRDLYVNIPGHGHSRINAVYGLAQRGGRDPLAALASVVSDTLRLPVRHTLAIDLALFERAINQLGGVSVDVACPIMDNFVDPRTPSGRRPLSLSAGVHLLDGSTAAMFVRSRHGRSDFGRARRQQLVLMGIRRKLATAAGLAQIPALLTELSSSVVTNMSRLELLSLAKKWLRVDRARVHGVVLGPKELTPHRTEKNRSVLLADELAIEQRLEKLFAAPAPGTRTTQSPCLPADVALRRDRDRAQSLSKNK